MTVKKGWYMASASPEEWRTIPCYETQEEAVAHAAKDLEAEVGDTFWVGKVFPVDVTSHLHFDADTILENARESCAEGCGDYADEILTAPSRIEKQVLEFALNEVFCAWVKRNNLETSYFRVEDTTRHKVKESADG